MATKKATAVVWSAAGSKGVRVAYDGQSVLAELDLTKQYGLTGKGLVCVASTGAAVMVGGISMQVNVYRKGDVKATPVDFPERALGNNVMASVKAGVLRLRIDTKQPPYADSSTGKSALVAGCQTKVAGCTVSVNGYVVKAR